MWIESGNLSFGNDVGSIFLTECDMKACISLAVTGLGFSLMLLSPSSATAATKADFEGKKVCWDGSSADLSGGSRLKNWTSFQPGGKATNSIAGDGTWAISKAGVITLKFPSGPYSGVITIMGGGMVEYSGSWVGTPKITPIGAFCN